MNYEIDIPQYVSDIKKHPLPIQFLTYVSRGDVKGAKNVLDELKTYHKRLNISNSLGMNPLHLSALLRNDEMAKFLLSSNMFNPESVDKLNRTPLFIALMFNNKATAKALACYNSNVSSETFDTLYHSFFYKIHNKNLLINDFIKELKPQNNNDLELLTYNCE